MTKKAFKPDVENVVKHFVTELKKDATTPWLRHARFFAKTTTFTAITGAALMAGSSSTAAADVVLTQITGSDNPFYGIDVGEDSAPTFVDIDDDGDLDAFIGESDGNINYYENQGDASSPSFVNVTGSGNPLDGIYVGGHSAPSFADIDGDGDPDAFIGEWDASITYISYYENQGNESSPNFVNITGSGNPLNDVDTGAKRVSVFADLDNDNDLDAYVGSGSGSINYRF